MAERRPTENAGGFAWSTDDVFGRIAARYDLLCDLFSLGLHRAWKRRVAHRLAAEPWGCLLDGATGTGDIVIRVLKRQPSQARRIVASDISEGMLAIARRRLLAHAAVVELRRLDAESMPSVADGSVDLYTISLALKICNRRRVFHEALRILRPGGRIIVLEASVIPMRFLQRAYLAYMSVCMPALGWLATGGDASAYRYLLKGIRGFPGAESLAEEMREAGFVDVEFERMSLGIVAIHEARKPALGAGR